MHRSQAYEIMPNLHNPAKFAKSSQVRKIKSSSQNQVKFAKSRLHLFELALVTMDPDYQLVVAAYVQAQLLHYIELLTALS